MNTSENQILDTVPTMNEKNPQMKSLRITIEKLDGGYISDAEGKRKIYKETEDVIDAVGINKLLNNIDSDEYKLNIDLVPKEIESEYIDVLTFGMQLKKDENIDLRNVIEKETFNPFPKKAEDNEPLTEIKVDEKNCYSTARLQAIDWNAFDQQLPLTVVEIAEITGANVTTMYSTWRKAKDGTLKYQIKNTKITMTILAKFYEKNLGIRTSTKEKIELLKEQMLKSIREMELMMDKKSHVKTSDMTKKINEMRKVLIN
jgi:hypothetical protein